MISATCRFYVAADTKVATLAVYHRTLLHAGICHKHVNEPASGPKLPRLMDARAGHQPRGFLLGDVGDPARMDN